MRVLLVSWEHPPVVVGGLGRHVHALGAHLAADGHEVVVLCRRPMGTDAATHPSTDEVVDGVRVVAVAEDPLHLVFTDDLVAWTLAMGHALLRAGLALGWRPDVVHAHDWLVAHPAVALAEHHGVPLVATVHATEAGRHGGWISAPLNRQVHSVEWWLVRSADAVITCSAAMRDEAVELFAPTAPITVLHNGVEPGVEPRVEPGVEQAPDVHRYPDDGTVLYLGRLEHEKGVHDLLAAMPRIRRAHPGARLVVAGAGTQQAWLRERARAHRVARAVTWTGHLGPAEIAEQLARATVVVLPSRYEPFGIVALEAAAARVPVVASDAGGLGEAVLDGVTGLAFPVGDVRALAAAVVAVLDDPRAAAARAEAAHARLATDFSWPAIAAATAELYARTRRRPREPLARPVIVERALRHR
ncbi:glycosyltransferase family 4 protein [Rhodococcus antarcticus]|uniref:Glycosyltransferase family 4 protein n=1 Tax=Rhodococcus antarcticus TaxID=2987751 RepID=A0ABY6P1X4_9NOCA|nr:glycosyltransferase family 4 protein [Rhodococcus antarcticus]UZJ25636.1 glycosyltransferase family 4 protein [Rhodococcus antarcticus]